MPKLTDLHEVFIEKAQRPMSFGGLPIRARHPETPVVPMDRWREHEGALYKTYRFRETEHRDAFVLTLLGYERETHHNALIRIDEAEVSLRLQTKTTEKVTELDKEYARYADVVFKDLVSRPSVVVGSDDGNEGGDLPGFDE
jgi:pterin-4a-carbinolamine dehydratase